MEFLFFSTSWTQKRIKQCNIVLQVKIKIFLNKNNKSKIIYQNWKAKHVWSKPKESSE